MPDMLVVQLGPHTYEVCRPWGRLPQQMRLSDVSAVAVNSPGDVYLCQRSDPPVVIFDRSGAYLRSWGTGLIGDAHGMYIDIDDHIWVVDRDAHQILQFDAEGTLLRMLGRRNSPQFQQPFNHPTDVALGPDRDIFVADGYGNSMIHRFSASGEWTASWGTPGAGPGQFSTPHAIWVSAGGRVVVCDRENNRLQFFAGMGEYLGELGDLFHPMDVYADSDNNLYHRPSTSPQHFRSKR